MIDTPDARTSLTSDTSAAVDRLVVLHGGALIAEGDPEEVIRRPQVSEIYMGIDQPELDAHA